MSVTNGVENHGNEATGNRLFPNIDSDDPANETTEIESLCVNCGENGITKLLLTKIPFYKEVILMSFECTKCDYSNNEIQSAGIIDERGVRVTLTVESADDLNRQVIKSDYASIQFPHLDFEIPPQSQKGEVTTVEGIISRAAQGLSQDQDIRRITDPEIADKLQEFITKLEDLKKISESFVMILEDISGNSWIENPVAPRADPNCRIVQFKRNREEDHLLGIYSREEVEEAREGDEDGREEKEEEERDGSLLPAAQTELDLEQEVMQFFTNCPSCSAPTTTNMKVTTIPYFKDVVIMATSCDNCGHRTNEVKSGAGIEPKGVKIEVTVSSREDFSRDVLKSETCSISVTELELEAGPYVVGGKFTTVEGLLTDLKAGLEQSVLGRDTLRPEVGEALDSLSDRLAGILQSKEAITLVLDDPAGNSYIQSLRGAEDDPALKITHYERTYEQNEELGINDMKTEGYEED